jgi:ribosome-binding factor A
MPQYVALLGSINVGGNRLKMADLKAALEGEGFRNVSTEVAQRLGLKFAPKLKFLADESFDEADRIERLLGDPRVTRDLDEG